MSCLKQLFLVIAGALVAGFAASFAAEAAGHDPTAGLPFPDLWGSVLFIICAICAPIVAALLASIANHIARKRGRSPIVPTAVSMLVIAPLLGMAGGAMAQSRVNHHKQREREFDVTKKQAYENYASRIRADPGIAIREKWYEEPSNPPWGLELSARRMVFNDSFDPKHVDTPYSPEQLVELSKLSAPEARIRIPYHPKCPASLIEELWPEVMQSGQSNAMEAIISNPSTPRRLLEQFMEDRKASGANGSSWLDKIVIKRLNEQPRN